MLHFLGIGAQKAGTTWLFSQLKAHPQIRFPAGKEVHFWNRPGQRDLAWYRAQFEHPDNDATKSGEITPAYAMLPPDRIAMIHSQFPNLRLLYMIRNPIERAWSSALMALKRAEMELDEASDQWFIDHFNSRGSRARGDYESCIRNWRSVFPDAQLSVERYEAIAREPRRLLQRISVHLGVDSGFYATVPDSELRRRIFEGSGHALRPSLRPELERLYRAKIRSLSAYLGAELDWLA
jgi:hypothetical protein